MVFFWSWRTQFSASVLDAMHADQGSVSPDGCETQNLCIRTSTQSYQVRIKKTNQYTAFKKHLKSLKWSVFTTRPHCSQEGFRPSVSHSVTFRYCVQKNEDTIVRLSASGRTILLVSGEVKFIRIFAGDHPSGGVKVRHPSIDSENSNNNRKRKWKRRKIGGELLLITNRKSHNYGLSTDAKIGDLE